MKSFVAAAIAALVVSWALPPSALADSSQRVDVAGSVYCSPTGSSNDAQAASKTLVLLPGHGTFLANDSGFFRLMANDTIVDQSISLHYYLSSGEAVRADHYIGKNHVFPEGGMRVVRLVPPDIVKHSDCKNIDGSKAAVVAAAEGQEDYVAPGGPIVQGLSSFLGLLSFAPAAGPPEERTEVKSNLPILSVSGRSSEGAYLYRMRTVYFLDPGFRFTSLRNPAYLALTNPSALALNEGGGIQTMGVLRFGQPLDVAVTGFFSRRGWALSLAHVLHTEAREQGLSYFEGSKPTNFESQVFEQSVVLALAHRLTERVSVAAVGRFFLQSREVADSVTETSHFRDDVLIDQSTRVASSYRHRFGATLGVATSYEPSPAIRISLTGLDLVGSRERFEGERRRNPSGGLGLAYYVRRLHLGADLLASREFGFDASIGANVRLANKFDFALGFLSAQRSARVSLRLFGLTVSTRYAATTDRFEVNLGGSWSWPL